MEHKGTETIETNRLLLGKFCAEDVNAAYVNWTSGESGKIMMPVSVRLNHAIADGYLVANVFRLLEKEIVNFMR